MINFALRVLLSALVFTFIVPHISGAHFTGSFWPDAVLYGVLLAIVAYLFNYVIAFFVLGTFGLGLFFVIFGYWFIPAIELKILAHFFPHCLVFQGWMGALITGLVLMAVNIITRTGSQEK